MYIPTSYTTQCVLSYCPVNPVDPLVIILGVLLGVCVVVITVQAILSHKKERYYCNKGEHFDLFCLLKMYIKMTSKIYL